MHLGQRTFLIAGILIPILFGSQTVHAQYTTDYQTNIISGVTSNWSGDYTVGSTTFANALLIRNGGVLSNADGRLAFMQASSNNSVVVAGTNSVWSNANLYVGYSGSANTLVISNAGRVANSQTGYIGYDTISSSNRVQIVGTNSVWDCATGVMLGLSGSGNSLIVSNGGRVLDLFSSIGAESTSSGNSATITGAGSVLSNSQSFVVGNSGSNNRLTISKGAQLYSDSATVGYSGNNNSILITDSGSFWDDSAVASNIRIGFNGSGNSLVVSNGGQVLGYYAFWGDTSSSNNFALVTGTGSSFSVNCYIYAGYAGHDSTFTLANGAAVEDKFCYIGYTAPSSHNSVLITGSNSYWHNSYSMYVGFDGVGGSLTVSNGASVKSTEDGLLGFSSYSHDNRALVTGGGSVWNSTLNMYVGYDGRANTLVIDNGGRVISKNGFLGTNPGSNSNCVMVVGAGSLWSNYEDNVHVGYSGAANSLVISNGGQVITGNAWLGVDTNSIDNRLVVTGAGSVWTNANAIFIGDFGTGNSLDVRDGGLVDDYWGIIGEEGSSSNNSAYVESGGVWRSQQLAVGDMGSHNALYVQGGSVFVATYMAVGYGSAYCNNLLQLESGEVIVTNAAGNAVLEVYDGSVALIGGTLRVDTLIVTNPCAQFMQVGGTLIYKSLILNPNSDADTDGIPNSWEQAHGLDPLNPLDAEADNDGDGMSNLQEYLAGTNPTDSASAFRIVSVTPTNNDVRITWRTAGGRTNVVQAMKDFSGSYSNLSPNIIVVGSGDATTNYLDVGGATNRPSRFYRIWLVP